MSFVQLPPEIHLNIVKHLSREREIPNLAQTNRYFRSLCSDKTLYKGEHKATLATKNVWNRKYVIDEYPCDLKGFYLRDVFSPPDGKKIYILGFTSETFQLRMIDLKAKKPKIEILSSDLITQLVDDTLHQNVASEVFSLDSFTQNTFTFASQISNRKWCYRNKEIIILTDPKTLETYSYSFDGGAINQTLHLKGGKIRGLAIFGKFLVVCAGGRLHLVDRQKMKMVKSFNRFYEVKGVTALNHRKIALYEKGKLKVMNFKSENAKKHASDLFYDRKSTRAARLVYRSVIKGFHFMKRVYKTSSLMKKFLQLSGKYSLITGGVAGGVSLIVPTGGTLLGAIQITALTAISCFGYTFLAFVLVFSLRTFFYGMNQELQSHSIG